MTEKVSPRQQRNNMLLPMAKQRGHAMPMLQVHSPHSSCQRCSNLTRASEAVQAMASLLFQELLTDVQPVGLTSSMGLPIGVL